MYMVISCTVFKIYVFYNYTHIFAYTDARYVFRSCIPSRCPALEVRPTVDMVKATKVSGARQGGGCPAP